MFKMLNSLITDKIIRVLYGKVDVWQRKLLYIVTNNFIARTFVRAFTDSLDYLKQ